MKSTKTAAPWPMLAAPALAMLLMSGCSSVSTKPTLSDAVPKAGCSERTAGLSYPPPPTTDALLDWKLAYLEGTRAFTSVVDLRIVTADCLDKHREKPGFFKRLFN